MERIDTRSWPLDVLHAYSPRIARIRIAYCVGDIATLGALLYAALEAAIHYHAHGLANGIALIGLLFIGTHLVRRSPV